jgi:UDP-3-O-[3-hydroxymyristoyl] glucosamine N-acyltransferase
VNPTVRQLADLVGGELLGDGDVPIKAARPLSEAGPHDLTFVDGDRYLPAWHKSNAAAAIVTPAVPLNGRPLIRVRDPIVAFATIVLELRGQQVATPPPPRIDPSAHIHPTAKLAADVTVGPNAVIGEGCVLGAGTRIHPGVVIGRNCTLGADCILYPNVVLYDGCVLGDRVILHANAVIGADGFGYRMQGGKHLKGPQLGHVEIGDDVEVGACSTIDRGTFGPTRVGAGTKMDNLVMIAHNCQIGRHNMICSQVGIAGSCVTGDYVVMAGQVGVADHVTIGEKAVLGAQSGVPQDVPDNGRVLGTPARPDKDAWRIMLAWEKLPELLRDVRKIKKHLGLARGSE